MQFKCRWFHTYSIRGVKSCFISGHNSIVVTVKRLVTLYLVLCYASQPAALSDFPSAPEFGLRLCFSIGNMTCDIHFSYNKAAFTIASLLQTLSWGCRLLFFLPFVAFLVSDVSWLSSLFTYTSTSLKLSFFWCFCHHIKKTPTISLCETETWFYSN